jgi:hypothetical protein
MMVRECNTFAEMTANEDEHAETKRLRSYNASMRSNIAYLHGVIAEKDDQIERYKGAIYRLSQWTYAYPAVPFPEPDFEKAKEVLSANGMTLDSISASNMRHVLSGVKDIIMGLEVQ